MSQQSQGPNSASPADVPMKRKRGRPRKDESLVQGENKPSLPGSDSVKKSKQSVGTSNAAAAAAADADNMVGQVVSGVIEGTFDAGYLLNVKVGDTDTHLRGVVFLPGRFTPITAENDVAPHAKMYKRKEIPIPALNPQSQLRGFVPPSQPSNKQTVEPKNHVPKPPYQVQPSKLQSSVPIAGESETPANKLTTNETGLSLGEKAPPQQILESGPENQTASVMAQLKHDEVVEQDEVHQEFEASALMKGPNIDVEATKESEPVSAPSVEPQVEHKDLSFELKPDELVHDEVKSPNLEYNQIPVFAESVSMSSGPIGINILMENQASSKQDTQLNLGNKIISGDDKSQLNGRPVSDAATITETGSNSAPITGLPVLTFEGETISSELKIATEGSSIPSMIDAQIYSSSVAADVVDCNMTDAIPSTQS